MAPPDKPEDTKPEPPPILAGPLNKFDRAFKGKLQGTTQDLSAQIEKASEGKVSASTSQKALPWLFGGLTLLGGAVLINPLTRIGRGIGGLAKQLVTGFGFLEGTIVTAAVTVVEVVSETLGAAAVVAASAITVKMFQSTPPSIPLGENLDPIEKRKKEDKLTHVIDQSAFINTTRLSDNTEQRAQETKEKVKNAFKETSEGKKPATRKQMQDLEKAVGGKENLKRLLKEGGLSENAKLTAEQASTLQEAFDAHKANAKAEHMENMRADIEETVKTGRARKPSWKRWAANKAAPRFVGDGKVPEKTVQDERRKGIEEYEAKQFENDYQPPIDEIAAKIKEGTTSATPETATAATAEKPKQRDETTKESKRDEPKADVEPKKDTAPKPPEAAPEATTKGEPVDSTTTPKASTKGPVPEPVRLGAVSQLVANVKKFITQVNAGGKPPHVTPAPRPATVNFDAGALARATDLVNNTITPDNSLVFEGGQGHGLKPDIFQSAGADIRQRLIDAFTEIANGSDVQAQQELANLTAKDIITLAVEMKGTDAKKFGAKEIVRAFKKIFTPSESAPAPTPETAPAPAAETAPVSTPESAPAPATETAPVPTAESGPVDPTATTQASTKDPNPIPIPGSEVPPSTPEPITDTAVEGNSGSSSTDTTVTNESAGKDTPPPKEGTGGKSEPVPAPEIAPSTEGTGGNTTAQTSTPKGSSVGSQINSGLNSRTAHGVILGYAAGSSLVIGLQEWNGKYTPAKVGDHFDHDGKTYKLIHSIPEDKGNLQKIGSFFTQTQNFYEIDEAKMPIEKLPRDEKGRIDIAALIKEHSDVIIQTGNHYDVDPTRKVHALSEFVNAGAMTAAGFKAPGAMPVAIAVVAFQDGTKAYELWKNGKTEEAKKELMKDVVVDGGKMAVMCTGPGGVLLVMTADTLAQVNDICNEVAKDFPKAERNYFVMGKDGKPEEITLKNAYKLNPNFQRAVEQAAIASTGPVTEEYRKTRTENMLSDPLYAWQVVWDHKMPEGSKIADYAKKKSISKEEAARRLLNEYADQTSADVKPNAFLKFVGSFVNPLDVWDSVKSEGSWAVHTLNFGSDQSFGQRINDSLHFGREHVSFEANATKAELAAIAQELKRYDSQLNATKQNLYVDSGTSGQSGSISQEVKDKTGVELVTALPQVNLVKGTNGSEVNWNQTVAELQKELKDEMVTGDRHKHAQDLTLLLRYNAQRHENAITFVKDIRKALNHKSVTKDAQDGRQRLINALTTKGHLTDAEVNALVVAPPQLNISFMPELEGFDRDGAEIPKPLEAFGAAFQKKYGKEFIRLQDTGGKIFAKKFGDIADNEKTTFVAKDFEDMSITEKNEFLNAALKYYEERMDFYETRYHRGEPGSVITTGERTPDKPAGYDYSADGPSWSDWFLRATNATQGREKGKVELPHGSMTLLEEHTFLRETLFNELQAAMPHIGKLETKPGESIEVSLGIVQWDMADKENRTRKPFRNFFHNALSGLSSNIGAHMKYMRDHETQDNGQIREYIRKARFMEASLALSEKGILLLASDKTNKGLDPMTDKIRDGSSWTDGQWILFKDLRNGKYYYAEGEWGSNSEKPDAPKEDFFRITHIKDQKTGERVIVEGVEGTVINFSDASKDTIIPATGFSARPGAITEALDKNRHLTPREKYGRVRTTMLDMMSLPPSLIARSPNDMDMARYDAIQGDKTLTLGKEASIDYDDFNTGLKYTLKGKWALTDEGDLYLKADTVVLHNMPGAQKDVEVVLAADENPRRLRDKILKEYLGKVTPQERAALFSKLDHAAYPEVESGAVLMPTVDQREKAMADAAAAGKLAIEEKKTAAVDAVKQKIASWVKAGKITIELEPDKKVDENPLHLPANQRLSEAAIAEQINLRSTVVMKLSDQEQRELIKMLVQAGVTPPNLPSKSNPLTLDSLSTAPRNGIIAALDNEARIELNDFKTLMLPETLREYHSACANCADPKRSNGSGFLGNLFGNAGSSQSLDPFINAGRGNESVASNTNPSKLKITPRPDAPAAPREGLPLNLPLNLLPLDNAGTANNTPSDERLQVMPRLDPNAASKPNADNAKPVTAARPGDKLRVTPTPSQTPKKTAPSKLVWREGYAMAPLNEAGTDGRMLMPAGSRITTKPVNEGPPKGNDLPLFIDAVDMTGTSPVSPTRLPPMLNLAGANEGKPK